MSDRSIVITLLESLMMVALIISNSQTRKWKYIRIKFIFFHRCLLSVMWNVTPDECQIIRILSCCWLSLSPCSIRTCTTRTWSDGWVRKISWKTYAALTTGTIWMQQCWEICTIEYKRLESSNSFVHFSKYPQYSRTDKIGTAYAAAHRTTNKWSVGITVKNSNQWNHVIPQILNEPDYVSYQPIP